MNLDNNYQQAIALLQKVSTVNGYLASSQQTANYHRVWARDGVICGLAALASGNKQLIETFEATLATLAKKQHLLGTIPSNVSVSTTNEAVSYGGLAGRVDAVTWFIIGVCQLAYYKDDDGILHKYLAHIHKCLALLEAWEFNNKHLLYVPLSGNWADEYITDGYVLYDQLLRVWAIRSLNHFMQSKELGNKEAQIIKQIEINYMPNTAGEKYHENAYHQLVFSDYMPCSFSPSGYKTFFDAFATSLALLLNIGSEDFQDRNINFAFKLASETKLGLLPAFWPPVFDTDEHWNLLKNNCKYEFRNYPYEFHNGGSWPMVNGFFGMALQLKNRPEMAQTILKQLDSANAQEDFSFYENFNTKTGQPNGVKYCAWSAAATILIHQCVNNNFKPLL